MSNWVEEQGGLPRYIKRIVKHLRAKGMSESHAIAVAVNATRRMCASGDLNFPGVQQVNPGSRAEACRAIAQWERKKAAAKADNRNESMMNETEQRTIDVDVEGIDTRGRTLHGYASVYKVESADLGGFVEVIQPGAFAGVLNADVRCLLNHDASQVLGRTRSGTLRLHDEERGLRFECDLPASPLGENVREAVKRGDIDGASFRFVVAPDGEQWSDDGERRTITAVKELHDVTVATYGAYPAASVELRSRPEPQPRDDMDDQQNDQNGGARAGRLQVEDRSAAPPGVDQRLGAELRAIRKGESRSLTTAVSISPGELSTHLFDRLRASSVGLRSGFTTITTARDSVTWPTLTADAVPAWYAEAAPITPGNPTFSQAWESHRKLGHLVQMSNELIDDSEPSIVEVLNSHLLKVLALKLDIGLFEGSGTAPEIRALKNVAGIQTVSMGTNGATLTNLDPIADAIALLEGANTTATAIVMPPARSA